MSLWWSLYAESDYRVRNSAAFQWYERVRYCHHNATQLVELERRMAAVLYQATDGLMSKPWYDLDTVLAEIADHQTQLYENGYEDGRTDQEKESQ